MKRTARWQVLVAVGLVIGWLLVGAGTPQAGPAAKTLVVGLVAEPTSMDPGQLTDVNSMRVLSSVYDTLVRFKEESFTLEPGLATSWTISEDGLQYTFKLVSWEKNVRIVLDANPGYWDGRPRLDRLIFRPLPEEQTRVTELLSGGVDFIVDVPPDNIDQVRKDARFVFYQQPGPHVWWVTLNVNKKPFSDVRVRQAANYAVNKEAIVNDILKGTATVSSGPVPPAITWAYTDQVARYPYDPAKAKQLLAEAGSPSGFPAIFWIPESGSGMQSPKTMAQAIQADLAVVGIKVQIQTVEWDAYLN